MQVFCVQHCLLQPEQSVRVYFGLVAHSMKGADLWAGFPNKRSPADAAMLAGW